MNTVLISLWDDIKALPRQDDSESTTELARTYGAMKLIFHLFQQFTSRKSLLESPQTLQLDSKERHKDKLDYFHPFTFLQQLRALILPTVSILWNSDELCSMTPSILRDLIIVLTQCTTSETSGSSLSKSMPRVQSAIFGASIVSSGNSPGQTGADYQDSSTSGEKDANFIKGTIAIQSDEQHTAMCSEQIRQSAIGRAIHILSSHQDMISDLSNLILVAIRDTVSPDEWLSSAVREMVDALTTLAAHEYSASHACSRASTNFDAVAQLFARLCHEEVVFGRCAHIFERTIPSLLHVLRTCSESSEEKLLDGFAYLLVVFDSLLAHFDDVIASKTDSLGAGPGTSSRSGSFSDEQKHSLLRSSLHILPRLSSSTAFLSTLRFQIRLTQHRDLANEFSMQQGIAIMFEAMKKHIATSDDNIRTTFIILLRHHTEHSNCLNDMIRSEIRSWFSNRTRAVDLSNFVKQNLAIALRDSEQFIAITEELCCLPRYDENTTLQAIGLRDTATNLSKAVVPMEDMTEKIQTCAPTLHLLLGEICRLTNELNLFDLGITTVPAVRQHSLDAAKSYSLEKNDTSWETPTAPSRASMAAHPFRKTEHSSFMYLAWLLSALAELLYSYTACKQALLTYKPPAEWSSTISLSQGSNDVLSLLTNKLACLGFGHITENIESRETLAIEQQAREAIAMLCTKTSEIPACDISHVHRAVLDSIIRKIRDTLGFNGPLEIRYNMMISLSELIQRLISADNRLDVNHASEADNQHEIGHLMLEKNFVNVLTQVISDIDLQYPAAKKVIRSLLKPLRSLTKLSSRLGDSVKMTTNAEDDLPHQNNQFEAQSAAIIGQHEDERDQTPDLYRNSALAMFGAEMHQSDEEAFDGDEDEQM